jgi:hypothetical protein
LHPMRRIEEIKSATEGELEASEIRKAAKLLEATTPVGAILATVAREEFGPALFEAANDRSAPQERAWLTLAAAGAERARLCLAWRASELLDPKAIVEVLIAERHNLREACQRRAEQAGSEDERGAWLLLSWLKGAELRRLVRGRPCLHACYRQMRAKLDDVRRPVSAPAPDPSPQRGGSGAAPLAGGLAAPGLI